MRYRSLCCLLLLGLLRAAPAAGQEKIYPDDANLAARVAKLVGEGGALVEAVELGKSLGGRKIGMLRLAAPGKLDPEKRPAMLVVGGLDGSHLLGTELALGVARLLIGRHAKGDRTVRELLARRTVYVIVRANPDGAARFLARPATGFSGNDRAMDRDRDGEKAEDGPRDLTGDGQVLWMRVKDPEGTFIADPAEPRLLRKADPARGERGVYKLMREGTDDDRDGELNEDPRDGVDPNRNFAHRYEMHAAAAGRFPSSEPSAKLLMDLLISRPNIQLVLVYGLDDNLVAAPAAAKPPGGRRPLVKLDPADLAYYKEVGRQYREVTGAKGKPRGVPGGTLFEWAYYQRGLPSFSVRGWYGPPPVKPDESKPRKKAGDKRKKERAKKATGTPHPDLPWIRYADRLKRGFGAWRPYDHPTLGQVEIGGFLPGFKVNPPATEVPALVARQAPFALRLLGLVPEVRLVDVKAVKLAEGLYRVTAAVTNQGVLPSMLAQAVRNQEVRPTVVRLEGEFTLLGARPDGYAQVLVKALAGGQRKKLSWLVRASGKLRLRMLTATGQRHVEEVTLP